jgi:hypothetical protein
MGAAPKQKDPFSPIPRWGLSSTLKSWAEGGEGRVGVGGGGGSQLLSPPLALSPRGIVGPRLWGLILDPAPSLMHSPSTHPPSSFCDLRN